MPKHITTDNLGSNLSFDSITRKLNITGISGAGPISYTDLTNKPTIPTLTSQLSNDSGFLTSIPVHTHSYNDLTDKPVLSGTNPWTLVKKSADEGRTTVTLSNDSTLIISLTNIGSRYHIRGRIYLYTGNANMDYKYATAFSGTFSGTTNTWFRREHWTAGAAAGTDVANTLMGLGLIASTSVTATTTGLAYIEFEQIIVPTTTGIFGFQWAQNTADTTSSLQCLAGSYLEYTII